MPLNGGRTSATLTHAHWRRDALERGEARLHRNCTFCDGGTLIVCKQKPAVPGSVCVRMRAPHVEVVAGRPAGGCC